VSVTVAPAWTERRVRAEELRAEHSFVSELLTLYLALLPVQEEAWRAVRESGPAPAALPRWAAGRVAPAVAEATRAAGPTELGEEVARRVAAGTEDALAGWLAGADLDAVDRYLARASLAPALEALGERAREACAPEEGAATCPSCGGLPQVSCLADTGDALVSGRRSLVCSRCATHWDYTRSACPACGEADEARLLVYAEQWAGPVTANGNGNGNGAQHAVFPHLRIAACETCRRYLIEIDMARDGHAVPEVDELAALPLDLVAADEGLTKVTPNLMGF
jgi:FdhE protein